MNKPQSTRRAQSSFNHIKNKNINIKNYNQSNGKELLFRFHVVHMKPMVYFVTKASLQEFLIFYLSF